ncbi:MAG: RNA-binding S4 domain-containing protein [Planctomycetota bacterium]
MAHENQSTIHLDQFLKAQGLVDTGGQAKTVIQAGEVTVNGEVDTRRRRQLRESDVVGFAGEQLVVCFEGNNGTSSVRDL